MENRLKVDLLKFYLTVKLGNEVGEVQMTPNRPQIIN